MTVKEKTVDDRMSKAEERMGRQKERQGEKDQSVDGGGTGNKLGNREGNGL